MSFTTQTYDTGQMQRLTERVDALEATCSSLKRGMDHLRLELRRLKEPDLILFMDLETGDRFRFSESADEDGGDVWTKTSTLTPETDAYNALHHQTTRVDGDQQVFPVEDPS